VKYKVNIPLGHPTSDLDMAPRGIYSIRGAFFLVLALAEGPGSTSSPLLSRLFRLRIDSESDPALYSHGGGALGDSRSASP
jgi:hypothetical protein